MKGTRTRQQAISAMCKGCICDPLSPGTWKQQTQACRIESCPLWPYRPVSQPESPRKRERRLKREAERREVAAGVAHAHAEPGGRT